MEDLWTIADRIEAEVLAALPVSEQETLLTLLERVRQALNLTLPLDESSATEGTPP